LFPSVLPLREVLVLLENRETRACFDAIAEELRALGEGVAIHEDRSPVMRSPMSFLAKADHLRQEITLNGCYLDGVDAFRRDKTRAFLVHHELFHLWAAQNALRVNGLHWKRLIDSQEERTADALALFCVCLMQAQREATPGLRRSILPTSSLVATAFA
jgi:hypothetical protein